MRNISNYLFFTVFLLFTSCKTFKVQDSKLNSVDGFDLTIEKALGIHHLSGWGGYGLAPAHGHYFVDLTIKIINMSEENKIIDFADFSLVDMENEFAYPLVSLLRSSAVNISAERQNRLRPGDWVKRRLVFSFPKGKRPKHLMYKEKLIDLNIS